MSLKNSINYQSSIFLALSGKEDIKSHYICKRLSIYFNIKEEDILFNRGKFTFSFYLKSYINPFSKDWFYTDGNAFSASAYPIFNSDLLDKSNGISLNDFARDMLNSKKPGLIQEKPPLCFLYHLINKDIIYSFNDSFGVGRLYYLKNENEYIVSNSIHAILLASNQVIEINNDYWSSYYVSGGGLGKSTYINGINLTSPGSILKLSPEGLSIISNHSVINKLLHTKNDKQCDEKINNSSISLIRLGFKIFPENLKVSISGGRDSRYVLAHCLKEGINFQSFTIVPPFLEGDIASKLHVKSKVNYKWEKIISKNTLHTDFSELDPLLLRAVSWFKWSGGDNWSTLMQNSFYPYKSRAYQLSSEINDWFEIGGHFGGLVGRSYKYNKFDVYDNNPSKTIDNYLNNMKNWAHIFIPEEIRQRGYLNLLNEIEEANNLGFHGFYALDYIQLMVRLRRQFPVPSPYILSPLFNINILLERFWNNPLEKTEDQLLKKLTRGLIPEWSEIKYADELSDNFDHNIVNKVSVRRKSWEINESDFYLSIEEALRKNTMMNISMDKVKESVKRYQDKGKNQLNKIFEFIFWHYACIDTIEEIEMIKKSTRY